MKRLFSLFLFSFTFLLVLGLGRAYAEVNYNTPSTNDLNKPKGWAYVEQLSTGVGTTELKFVNTRTHASCFEYRTDGDTTQKYSIPNYNTAINDGLYPFKCVNSSTFTITINADEYVEIRMVFGAERDERFDWTRFDVLFNRTAQITSPSEGEVVWGNVDFEAILNDKENNDNVQWAVREGTCAAGTVTVFGNVDGFHNDFEWNGETFTSTADTSLWKSGKYCFVFNPTESSGDKAIRITREFIINPDLDGDSVQNDIDFCPTINSDILKETLGVNRHIWDITNLPNFTSLVPGKKGAKDPLKSQFTITDTKGCSCIQILDLLKENGLGEFGGHYKFGCSKSVMQDFILDIKDNVIDGKYLFDTFIVNSNSINGANSPILPNGIDFVLEVSGVWQNRVWEKVDAKYTSGDNWASWFDAPSGGYTNELLELQINEAFVDWGDYSSSHTYTENIIGGGSTINFRVFDGNTLTNTPDTSWYSDNIGELTVKIYAIL